MTEHMVSCASRRRLFITLDNKSLPTIDTYQDQRQNARFATDKRIGNQTRGLTRPLRQAKREREKSLALSQSKLRANVIGSLRLYNTAPIPVLWRIAIKLWYVAVQFLVFFNFAQPPPSLACLFSPRKSGSLDWPSCALVNLKCWLIN